MYPDPVQCLYFPVCIGPNTETDDIEGDKQCDVEDERLVGIEVVLDVIGGEIANAGFLSHFLALAVLGRYDPLDDARGVKNVQVDTSDR